MQNITVWSNVLAFSLVIATLGLELNAAAGHDSSSQHVAVKLLLSAEEEERICFEIFAT